MTCLRNTLTRSLMKISTLGKRKRVMRYVCKCVMCVNACNPHPFTLPCDHLVLATRGTVVSRDRLSRARRVWAARLGGQFTTEIKKYKDADTSYFSFLKFVRSFLDSLNCTLWWASQLWSDFGEFPYVILYVSCLHVMSGNSLTSLSLGPASQQCAAPAILIWQWRKVQCI